MTIRAEPVLQLAQAYMHIKLAEYDAAGGYVGTYPDSTRVGEPEDQARLSYNFGSAPRLYR